MIFVNCPSYTRPNYDSALPWQAMLYSRVAALTKLWTKRQKRQEGLLGQLGTRVHSGPGFKFLDADKSDNSDNSEMMALAGPEASDQVFSISTCNTDQDHLAPIKYP